MRTFSKQSILSLVGVAGLCAGACSSSKTPAGEGGVAAGCPLTPTATGFVSDTACSGVVGAWYAYGDSAGANANLSGTDSANSDCIKKGGFTIDKCSQITTPIPGQPFAPDASSGAMCTSGTAAMVLPGVTVSTPADYSDLWGAGIGLDLNNPGGDAGVAKGYYDLSKYKGVSFDFTGDVIPVNKMRVNFPFQTEHGTDSPYWMGATAPASTLTNGAHVEIEWSAVGGPAYLSSQSPPVPIPAFDPTVVSAIQFQVFTNTSTATPYAFCVNNLTLLAK